MAEETTLTPVEGAEPPKANPLAKPAGSSSTLKLKPIERTGATAATASGLKLPPKQGLSTAGLKLPPKQGLASGLKLPPKPGMPTQTGLKLPPKPGFASGLKLPPKPGLPTQTGLKMPSKPGLSTAGLKLPPKPGMPTQTGLKVPPKPSLPTQAGLATAGLKTVTTAGLATHGLATSGLKTVTKPVIRKPGSTVPLTRPTILRTPTVTAATVATAAPAAPAAAVSQEPVTVVAPAPAAAAAPAAPAVPELTPVTATEVGAAEKPLEALKSATQNLKSLTAPIPQQAILRKTGMLAEDQSDGQKQAAKSKTSRISLSEAMGAAPVLNENAPMKTIRIKRPIDIPGVTKTEIRPPESATPPPAVDSEASTVVKTTAEPPTEPAATMTQRKTLKIARPSSGVVRPSGKFGIKRPGTMMTSKTSKPAVAKPAGTEAPKAEGDVPEVADIPSMPAAPVAAPVTGEKELPKGVSILGIIVQTAACATMGALAWWLYTDTQILPF